MNVRTHYLEGDRVDVVEGERLRSVPLEAVATRMELLGYTDPADALAACLAEMELEEDSHPYDRVYDSYLPHLRQARGYRTDQDLGDRPFVGATMAGSAPQSRSLQSRLEEDRRVTRAEIGAPEPGSSFAHGSLRSGMGQGRVRDPETESGLGLGSIPGGPGVYSEVFTLLRNDPLIAELREEFRDQLVPPLEPRENV